MKDWDTHTDEPLPWGCCLGLIAWTLTIALLAGWGVWHLAQAVIR